MSKKEAAAYVLVAIVVAFAAGFRVNAYLEDSQNPRGSEPVIEMIPVFTHDAKVSIRGYSELTCTVEVPNNNQDALWQAWTECDDAMYTAKMEK